MLSSITDWWFGYLAIVVTAAKRGFLVPKSKWDFFESEDKWPAEWLGSLKSTLMTTTKAIKNEHGDGVGTFYVLLKLSL
ncbi:hypothetical protein O9992_22305 [Vibrio lentus]|nr:hypothetical protein [Vibrio lentus]